MGWRPHEVRAVSFADFQACLEAFNEMHGAMTPEDRAELLALLDDQP